jgi:hypothetical protein
LPCRAEAQEKHDYGKRDVEPGVGRIIRHDPKRVAGVNGEASNSDDGVNDAEDLKPHSRWSHAACLEQKDDTRRKVNDVVCQLTWNVLSSIPSGVAAGTKPRIPTTKKTRPKITANVLTILISYWLKKLRLWQALRR